MSEAIVAQGDIHEQIDCFEALIEAHQFDDALAVYQDIYIRIARSTLNSASSWHYLFPIPGESYMDLYFGHSEDLGAFKIGISQDAEKRAKTIRSTNALHGSGSDFQLIDYVRGPTLAVRQAETKIKRAYAHAVVRGAEWIGDCHESALDFYWVERDRLFEEWERQMREFDPIAQLNREDALVGALFPGAITAVRRIESISTKIKDWNKAVAAMNAAFQRMHQGGPQ